MIFLDDEISMLDAKSIRILRQIAEDYGEKYITVDGLEGLRYKDDKVIIQKVDKTLEVLVDSYAHGWIKIWDNYNNQMIHKDFIEYIKRIPEREEEKILASSKYAVIDGNYKELKGHALQLHKVSDAINNLDNYEDDYIKIDSKVIRTNDVIKSNIISHKVITKLNNEVVYNVTCDKDRVLINTYKQGSWQDYIISISNAKNMLDDTYDMMITNTLDECIKTRSKDYA